MENFNDDYFEEDEFSETSSNSEELNSSELVLEINNDLDSENDLTTEVLKIKGISDPSKIKFEDESGAIVERSWDLLSKNEQLNILTQSESDPETDLSDEEIELLNNIRTSGKSVESFLNGLQNLETTKQYKVDDLSDEDLYALDLLEKIGSDNISDEELTEAVSKAKENEDLFKKTAAGLRNEYRRLQEDEEVQKHNELLAKLEADYNKFATSIMTEIKGLNSFAGNDLELSEQDMNELASFILELDESGTSAFGKALLDPTLFTEAAFWLLNKNEIIEELNKLILDNYKRGYEAAKRDLNSDSKVVFKKPQLSKSNTDDFIDDDDW